MTDLASVMRTHQRAPHTAPPHETTALVSAPSPEVASLKEGFRYGVGVGLVVGLGAALITFVVGIALGGVL